jgi:probable phosphomutase (TIGR03848 family)
MATVILVRHGRSTANTGGVLAGREAGVRLDESGLAQARRVGERLAAVPLVHLVTSPLERCRQTARAIAATQAGEVRLTSDRRLTECDYGQWQGRPIKELAREKLWTVVQQQPSAAVFPDGESLRDMQDRAVAAVRRHDRSVEEAHGPDAVWVAVSHGDVIKSILADALGTHLDHFQRIQVDPASISIVRYTQARPFVLGMNTHDGDLTWLAPARRRRRRARTDATVGGGAGPGGEPTRPRGRS